MARFLDRWRPRRARSDERAIAGSARSSASRQASYGAPAHRSQPPIYHSMAAKHLRPRKRGEPRTLSGQTRLWAIKETLRQRRRVRTQGVAALRDDISVTVAPSAATRPAASAGAATHGAFRAAPVARSRRWPKKTNNGAVGPFRRPNDPNRLTRSGLLLPRSRADGAER
jgi:hypothetical protein